MIYKTAEYKIMPEKMDEALLAIREFVSKVHENEPETLVYEAYQKDYVSFIHFMAFKDKEAEERHRSSDYVKDFVVKLYQCCSADPVFTDLSKV